MTAFSSRTSFDTWEGSFRFDNSFGMLPLFNETFNIAEPLSNGLLINANISQISFEITLPNNYVVQNQNDVIIEGSPVTPISVSDQQIVSKNITAGQTFNIIVVNTNLEPWQKTGSFIGNIGVPAVIISIIADPLAGYLYDRREKKEGTNKEDNNKSSKEEIDDKTIGTKNISNQPPKKGSNQPRRGRNKRGRGRR